MAKNGKLQLDCIAGEEGVMYIRVSTPDQEDGTSLETQREKNLALADVYGVVIRPDRIISEVWSAADPDRPGLRIVWDLVARREVTHVFVYDTDRLARDPWHVAQFIRHCKQFGVTLHFADGTTVETILDEVIQYLRGFVGHQEREKIAERTMNGKIATAKANRMPNGCGRGLYGYDYDRHTHTRSINEAEAAVVREMFEWRLSGVSGREITRRLKRAGIRTKTGGEWDSRTVHNILRNQAFTGVQWWGKHRYEKVYEKDGGPKRRVTLKPQEEWIQLDGFSPMIIEPAIYEAVQAAMERSRRPIGHWDYVFTPFFFCGECGGPVCGATQKRRYPYYRCIGTLAGQVRPRVCSLKAIRADQLEPVAWDQIRAAVQDPSGIISDLRQASGDGGAGLDRRISRLEGQVTKGRLELATLVLQRTKKIIDQELLETLSAPVNNLLAQHKKDIELLIGQKNLNEHWDHLEEGIRVAFARYADGLDSLDSEGRQRLMRLLNVRLVAEPGRVMVTGVLDPSLFTTGQTLGCQRVLSRAPSWPFPCSPVPTTGSSCCSAIFTTIGEWLTPDGAGHTGRYGTSNAPPSCKPRTPKFFTNEAYSLSSSVLRKGPSLILTRPSRTTPGTLRPT